MESVRHTPEMGPGNFSTENTNLLYICKEMIKKNEIFFPFCLRNCRYVKVNQSDILVYFRKKCNTTQYVRCLALMQTSGNRKDSNRVSRHCSVEGLQRIANGCHLWIDRCTSCTIIALLGLFFFFLIFPSRTIQID